MEQDVLNKLNEQDRKLEQIYVSVEKTRKYFLWAFLLTVVTFVLPLIGLIFAIPFFLSSYTNVLGL
jgi:CHASE3 domain sensor protein